MIEPESLDNLKRYKKAIDCVASNEWTNCDTCEPLLRRRLAQMSETIPFDLLLSLSNVIYEHRKRELIAEMEQDE